MGIVVQWPKHILERHENCDDPHCPICEGGLSYCRVCCGAEGSLATDCPGEPMTNDQADGVYEGCSDYIRKAGGWVYLIDGKVVL